MIRTALVTALLVSPIAMAVPGIARAAAPRAASPAAQAPAAASATTPAPTDAPDASQAARPDPALEPTGYTYDPRGRRDPFVSPMRRGVDSAPADASARPSGLAGLSASEVALRGTLRGRDGFVGMVEGVDKKTYLVRTGDRLRDGTVRSVDATVLVILQRVDDPLSRETERIVRKTLRQSEEAR